MEATNGSFVYRDTLFANVGEGKRFPRATVADLNALLLPKKNSAPVKDETANFYIAQLMHYGLPKTKDKNTAKVRLTSALSTGQLSVPSDVQKIETDLKKEYASLQRRAKLASKKEDTSAPAKAAVGQKRKASAIEETSISISTNGLSVTVNQTSSSSTAKKQKTPAPKKEASEIKTTTKKPSAKPAAQNSTKVSPVKAVKVKTAAKPTTKTPQTARSIQHPSVKKPVQTARRSQPFPTRAVSDGEDVPPPPYSEYENHNQGLYYQYSPGIIQISGEYQVVAPAYDNIATIKLRLSHPRDQMWGRFFLGDRQGLIRMDGIGGITRGTRHSFGWRSEGTDTETDLKFGKGCEGWVEFDGNGSMRGVFFGFKSMGRLSDVSFRGDLAEDYSYESDDERDDIVGEMEREWHEFTARAYGR